MVLGVEVITNLHPIYAYENRRVFVTFTVINRTHCHRGSLRNDNVRVDIHVIARAYSASWFRQYMIISAQSFIAAAGLRMSAVLKLESDQGKIDLTYKFTR